jgi:hypothetical protein
MLNDRVILVGGLNGNIYAMRMPEATCAIRGSLLPGYYPTNATTESDQYADEVEIKPKEGSVVSRLWTGLIPSTPFTKYSSSPIFP